VAPALAPPADLGVIDFGNPLRDDVANLRRRLSASMRSSARVPSATRRAPTPNAP
jgi:hypothetical protein